MAGPWGFEPQVSGFHPLARPEAYTPRQRFGALILTGLRASHVLNHESRKIAMLV